MKYLFLVWAGLWRKRARSILTMLSIVVAFLLFGLLQGINQGMKNVFQSLNVDRLYVQSRISMSDGLPISYLEQIKSVPGVRNVTHWSYFGGFYQNVRNSLPVFAIDAATQFAVYPKIKISPEEIAAMRRTRAGAIMAAGIAAKYGWKIGDKIPLQTSIWTKKDGSDAYPVDVVGIMDISAYNAGSFPAFYINYDYFDEARAFGNGSVLYYIVSIDDPRRGPEIAAAIDARFANSSNETTTQTEQVFAQSQIKQIGDINLIANSIVGAALFALLFVTGNTMMQSVRERIPEFAVLKTLGYSDGKVLTLIMLEAVALCVVAGATGLLLARAAFAFMHSLFGALSPSARVMEMGMGIAMLLALVSGLPPAWRSTRISIIDALAGR
ncbi:MAG TPA: ABC transporter permease [Steroidobacteraceae bacterium]|nr:ABC transporter permease [Steroidobacteraceae bacterium]